MKIKKIIVMLAVGFIAPLLTSCSENDNPVDPEEEVVHISGIDITATGLNEGEATLAVGSTLQLSADIYPPNATEVDVEWTSSDEDVVSVSKRGLVTALKAGDVVPARITHLESFGAFADVGCGIVALLPIDAISVSRIEHPKERFSVGMDIKAVIKSIENGRISLSHKELLGTWEENVAAFRAGETVSGIVRSVENYGAFVELSPNLAGLAESKDGVRAGQQASVYIKSIIPEKMKIKLIIIDTFDYLYNPQPPRYYQNGNHIDRFLYSPENSRKRVESVFES